MLCEVAPLALAFLLEVITSHLKTVTQRRTAHPDLKEPAEESHLSRKRDAENILSSRQEYRLVIKFIANLQACFFLTT